MSELLERPPRTIMEVYKMLPEGTLAELIDGIIYMSPSPVTNHQRIVRKLLNRMSDFVERNNLGEMFVSPFDVYLDEDSNAVQPDVIFVAKENENIVEDHIHGVPDLLIELLSPGNKSHDTVRKKNLYEKFGVKEYWIIDPETKESIGYELEGTGYKEFFRSFGQISSRLLDTTFNY
ncbi:MAG: Uma2 family endonuclease [Bacteroidota bacterium]